MPRKSRPKRKEKIESTEMPLAIDTVDQLKALAHPLRQTLLDQFSRGPVTTKQVATSLGLQPTRLYHHVAKLEDAGLLRLVEKRQVRGATEKYYETTANSMKIDRGAIKGPSADLVQGLLTQGVLDSLLSNIRSEIAEHLARDHSTHQNRTGRDPDVQDVMFAATEVVASERKIAEFKKRLLALVEEYTVREDASDTVSQTGAKHRILLGCYPISRPGDI